MWYLFKDTSCIGHCSNEPNQEELMRRGITAIFSEKNIQIDKVVLIKGEIEEKLPTLAEVKLQAVNDLDLEYKLYFTELSKTLGIAMLDNNIDLINELRAEYIELKRLYDLNRGEIENG